MAGQELRYEQGKAKKQFVAWHKLINEVSK